MQRIGYSYGPIDYKTSILPTLGASNSEPHSLVLKRIDNMITNRRKQNRIMRIFMRRQ